MKAVLVNYNFSPTWLLDSDLDYHLIDRSDSKDYLKDFPPERVTYDENFGQVDFPKLMFLSQNYDHLPEYFLWGKSNLFKFISLEEWEKIKDNKTFTPVLTQNHRTYSDPDGNPVCFYADGIYHERQGVAQSSFDQFGYRFCKTYDDFADMFGLTHPPYFAFAPGGNYILTRECVHRFSRDFYYEMASILPYAQEPREAHMCERTYLNLWR